MSYESVIADLKRLNRQDLLTIPATEHSQHMRGEADRSAIILLAASLEHALLHELKRKMPSLNSEEQERLFNFEGPCGSFSNRIRLAQGLGLIDRQTRKQVELIKEMRNAAAHSFLPINFETPQIRAAVTTLFPPKIRGMVEALPNAEMRQLFVLIGLLIAHAIAHNQPTDLASLREALDEIPNKQKQQTSPDKSSEA